MQSIQSSDVVHDLNALFRDGTAGGLNDGQLLSRFLDGGDETAFSILVERHGPVVMRVCRSVLGSSADADDAFQTTFLALARRARSLRDHASVGPWLVGASYRIARRSKIDAFRRSLHERRAAESRPSGPATSAPPSFEVWTELYEELGRLPGKFRDPLVLCYLEGHTAEQAAERLGCPRGTILSRTARAKERLKDRLTRRGVTAADAVLTAGLTPASASAPLPAGLAAATTRAAMQVANAGMISFAWSAVVVAGLIAATLGLALAAKPRSEAPKPPPVMDPPAARKPQKSDRSTKTLIVEARDLAAGAPMPGVEVMLYVWRIENGKQTLTTDDVSQTDGDGQAHFELKHSDEISFLRPRARREGYVPVGVDWGRAPSSPVPPDRFLLEMEKATTIKGRVVDEAGKPIAGATIVATVEKAYPGHSQEVDFRFESTRTDAEGRWSFIGVPERPDSVKLAAYHHLYLDPEKLHYVPEEFKPLSALRNGSATLHLNRGTRIDGLVVTPDGRPEPNAQVNFDDDRRAGNSIPPVLTNAEGKFALGFKPGASFNLTVLAAGHAPTRTTVAVGTTPVTLSINLQPRRRLQGRIVDSSGKPITRADVRVIDWKGFGGFDQVFHPDAKGVFTWNDAPGDEVRIQVSADGHARRDGVSVSPGALNQVVLTARTTIKGTVVDQATGEPIPSYSLLAGVVWRPHERFFWQRGWNLESNVRRFPDGFECVFGESVDRYVVRVEAQGYAPADGDPFAADGETHAFVYRLTKAEPIRGVVRKRDGSPANDGYVYLVVESDSLQIDNGQIDDDNRSRLVHARIEADGGFILPAQKEPYLLVALSKDGIAVDDRRTGPGEAALRLAPWARVSGVVTRDGKPSAQANLSSYIASMWSSRGFPMLEQSVHLTTDAEGRFAFGRLTPGRHVLRRIVPNIAPGRFFQVDVATLEARPGESYTLNIGASGHTVVGALALTSGRPWIVRKASVEPRGEDASAPSYGVEVSPGGRFRADDVPPGSYVLRIALDEPPPPNLSGSTTLVAGFSHEFKVAAGGGFEPVDLGTLNPFPSYERPIEIGRAAPGFEVKALDGRVFSIADFKGNYVLLHFWVTRWAHEFPNLKAVHERFADDPRFVMISLSEDERLEDVSYFIKDRKPSWPQCWIGAESSVAADYGALGAIPRTILIGPDGRVIARDLHGERIAEAIAEALGK